MQKAGKGPLLRERPLILQCSLLVEMQGTNTEMDTQEKTEDKWLSARTSKAFIPVANFEWQASPNLWQFAVKRVEEVTETVRP